MSAAQMQALLAASPCAASRPAPRRARPAPPRCSAASASSAPASPAASAAQLARRSVLAAAPLGALAALLPPPALADESESNESAPPSWSVPVVLCLSPGLGSAESLLEAFPSAALYVTVRPPGRTPPLAARRIPLASLRNTLPIFPLRLALGPSDALPDAPERSVWAAAPQLVLSARLDVDGVAASRDPDDLVGRGAAPRDAAQPGGWGEATVQLVGRGLAGRMATQRTPSAP